MYSLVSPKPAQQVFITNDPKTIESIPFDPTPVFRGGNDAIVRKSWATADDEMLYFAQQWGLPVGGPKNRAKIRRFALGMKIAGIVRDFFFGDLLVARYEKQKAAQRRKQSIELLRLRRAIETVNGCRPDLG
jgi:hypothetical protein